MCHHIESRYERENRLAIEENVMETIKYLNLPRSWNQRDTFFVL